MEFLVNLWAREPARVVYTVQMILLVLVSVFGVNLTGEQQMAILGLVGAVIALFGGEVIRSQVTSPATMERIARGELRVDPVDDDV